MDRTRNGKEIDRDENIRLHIENDYDSLAKDGQFKSVHWDEYNTSESTIELDR